MPKKKAKTPKRLNDKQKTSGKSKTAPTKKRAGSPQTHIRVGNLSDIRGNVNVAGGNITTHHTTTGLSAEEIEQVFAGIYTAIEFHPNTPAGKKENITAEVNEIQSAVTEAAQKNEKVDEGFLSRRFRSIARMAPDMLDVILATLGNPVAGLGMAMKKIAEKAREETR
jgi:hypothetical protein